jgi:hypothetical protein
LKLLPGTVRYSTCPCEEAINPQSKFQQISVEQVE